jgi:NAD(P)-dependent dehydrogenase (short-subunit alcohol dehydrogenase family)
MQRVLVTGASRGIGLEFVRQYLEAGAHVYATCRQPLTATELAALGKRDPERLAIMRLDVTRAGEVAFVAQELAGSGATLDLLINNAGAAVRDEGVATLDAATMMQVYLVNAVAPMIVARAFLGLLARGEAPKIINISSTMGSLAGKKSGGHYSYCGSKAALNMMTRALAHDLREQEVGVYAVHPGWVKTDLGGKYAEISPEASVSGMRRLIETLDLDGSGGFFTWEGEVHPW